MSQKFEDGPKPARLRADVESVASRPPPAAAAGLSPSSSAYYTPPPSVAAPTGPTDSTVLAFSRLRLVGMGVGAAAVLALVIWLGFTGGDEPSPPVAGVAAVNEVRSLSLSAADRDDRATERLKVMLAAGSAGTSVAAAVSEDLKADNAPALMRLAEAAPRMAEELQSGRRRLYRVYLLDFLEQDGDQVELFFDGVSCGAIGLKNEGASLLLPIAAGAPLQVRIQAVADGGGGVTVAFISSLGEARTSVLQVGQFEQWQVLVP